MKEYRKRLLLQSSKNDGLTLVSGDDVVKEMIANRTMKYNARTSQGLPLCMRPTSVSNVANGSRAEVGVRCSEETCVMIVFNGEAALAAFDISSHSEPLPRPHLHSADTCAPNRRR